MSVKHGIELNGLTCLKLLIQLEVNQVDQDKFVMNKETYDSFNEQLKLMELYMREYSVAINSGVKPPYWHELIARNK